MDLKKIDDAIDGAKDRWDHPDVLHGLDVQALIRAAEAMRGMLALPSIRVVEMGDHDDQMRLRIIGPFPTEAERDAELARLKGLPLMQSLAVLSSGTIPPADAEQSIPPSVSATVRDANELFEALWSHS